MNPTREKTGKRKTIRPVILLMVLFLVWPGGVVLAAERADDYLHVVDAALQDASGNPVRLTGIAWPGFESQNQVFNGLWNAAMEDILDRVADLGFNVLRIPLSVALVNQWRSGGGGEPGSVDLQVNPALEGLNSLQVLEASMDYCRQIGMKVMLDMQQLGHAQIMATDPSPGDSANDYEICWQWLARHFAQDDTVIAVCLANSPPGASASDEMGQRKALANRDNLKQAEKAAGLILKANPHLLIVVEGVGDIPGDSQIYTAPNEADQAFWCLDPDANGTGGILLEDWRSVNAAQYALIEPSLWKDIRGKFIGLDHQVDLGANGTHVGAGTGNGQEHANINAPATSWGKSPAWQADSGAAIGNTNHTALHRMQGDTDGSTPGLSAESAASNDAASEGDALSASAIKAVTLKYAEGGDPSSDPAVKDAVPLAKRRYVDAVNGKDTNNGQTPATAWKTIKKVNQSMAGFQPGTHILFKRGQIFAGNLNFNSCQGTDGHRIVFGAYGAGFSNGDGDPFNDRRPNINGNCILGGRTTSWLMIRDLDSGKISGSNVNDIVIFNNVVHGKKGLNQRNLIHFGDNATRCAIVQNLVYDAEREDLITLHAGQTATSTVGPHHWIVDNIIVGNENVESGIDICMTNGPPNAGDVKIIGNRIQMTAGSIQGLTQNYKSNGIRGIEGNHVSRHTWIMGNMITGARQNGIKHAGRKQYVQISGNLVWRCATGPNLTNLIDLGASDVVFEHNTCLYTMNSPRTVLQLLNGSAGGGFKADNAAISHNLFIRTTNGPWFGTWSPGVISAMDSNWYGETIAGTLNGQTLSKWQQTTGLDARSLSGNVPGVSVPSASVNDQNPKNWYSARFLAYFTPGDGWKGNFMADDGTPAGAINCDGSWHGGGPSGANKWNPRFWRQFRTLKLNFGQGWAGPLIVQTRYDLLHIGG